MNNEVCLKVNDQVEVNKASQNSPALLEFVRNWHVTKNRRWRFTFRYLACRQGAPFSFLRMKLDNIEAVQTRQYSKESVFNNRDQPIVF